MLRTAGLNHSYPLGMSCREAYRAFGELEFGFWSMKVELELSLGWKL